MRITINAKYRTAIRILFWIISLGSIIIAFFSLPTVIAVIIAIFCIIIPLLLEKIIFRYNIIWVYPKLSNVLFNRLGFSWYYQNPDKSNVGLAVIFERKYDAKEAYSIFKSWNYDKFIDAENNINITFVDEGKNKYSVFIYPGERKVREKQLLESLKKNYPENSKFVINKKVFIWIQNCADYSKNPKMIELIENIKKSREIILNTTYVVNNEIKSYTKKGINIKMIRFIKRIELTEKDLESFQKWEDPKKYSKIVERVSKINLG